MTCAPEEASNEEQSKHSGLERGGVRGGIQVHCQYERWLSQRPANNGIGKSITGCTEADEDDDKHQPGAKVALAMLNRPVVGVYVSLHGS